jgi:hypothetical protein
MFSGLDGFLTPCNRKALDNPPAWIYSSSLRGVDSICLPVTNQAVLTQKEGLSLKNLETAPKISCK